MSQWCIGCFWKVPESRKLGRWGWGGGRKNTLENGLILKSLGWNWPQDEPQPWVPHQKVGNQMQLVLLWNYWNTIPLSLCLANLPLCPECGAFRCTVVVQWEFEWLEDMREPTKYCQWARALNEKFHGPALPKSHAWSLEPVSRESLWILGWLVAGDTAPRSWNFSPTSAACARPLNNYSSWVSWDTLPQSFFQISARQTVLSPHNIWEETDALVKFSSVLAFRFKPKQLQSLFFKLICAE